MNLENLHKLLKEMGINASAVADENDCVDQIWIEPNSFTDELDNQKNMNISIIIVKEDEQYKCKVIEMLD